MRRLGVFGGTFDPVHLGHLTPALAALERFSLEAIVFVPAASPPHKLAEPVSPFAHRFAMLALATAPWERFLLSDLEQARNGPSYTVDTLLTLRQSWPADEVFFLLGSDSLAQIATWYRWEEILELAHLLVLHREPYWGAELERLLPSTLLPRLRNAPPGGAPPLGEAPSGLVYLLDHPPMPIAATEVRRRLGLGASVEEFLPPQVATYAVRHRLYHRG